MRHSQREVDGKEDDTGCRASVMGRGRKKAFRTASRAASSVRSRRFLWTRTHQTPLRVNHQFHEHLPLDTFALRQPWVTVLAAGISAVHGVE